jgi:thiol-disulfide isomerase/thioredoxin
MKSEIELPSNIKRYGYDLDNLSYCHHCKQIKQSLIHAKCNYNSTCVPAGSPEFRPVAVHIDKVKIFNVDQNSENVNDTLILKKLVFDKKRRKALEA